MENTDAISASGVAPWSISRLSRHRVAGVARARDECEPHAGQRDLAAGAAAEHERADAGAAERGGRPPSGGSSRSPVNLRANRPVNAGAEPSATTVPTATPVSSTAAKKLAW